MNAREAFGGPQYRKLLEAVRKRLETDGAAARSVTLLDLDDDERRALADLLGATTLPRLPHKVPLTRLDAALRGSRFQLGLVEVVEAIGGPLVDRRARRTEERDAVERMWREAAFHGAIASRPELRGFLDELRRKGLLTRIGGADPGRILARTLDAVGRLPGSGVQRSVLAAELAGDAHALDDDRPLSTLVLRAAARIAGWPNPPTSSMARRRLWAEVGVVCDPLSADVLVHGLCPSGEDRLARHLRESAADGEPRRVTLREILRSPLAIDARTRVFVCENPGVVAAAADQLGASSHALVCVDGNPTTAALELLRRVRSGGATILVHADFDWAGVRIVNALVAQLEAAPWRFCADDYRRVATALAEAMPLDGTLVRAAWDADLAPTMRDVGRAIFEEQMVSELLADLAR